MRTVGTVIATALLAAAAVLLPSATAQASCAGPPADSPNAFTGTVVSTDREGRVAEVVRDDGTRVVVHGSPTGSGATSVDRTYVEGARYEFHPVNATSPFQDNACTATRQVSGPAAPVSAAGDGADDRLPGWLPVDGQAGAVGYAAAAGVLLLVVAAAATLALARRRGQPTAAAFMSRRSSGGSANSSDSSAETTSSTSP